jgi:CheY-like chemotaxis protein
MDRIFAPFQQAENGGRSSGGLGLGLAICKGLIEAHQGSIRVSNGPAGAIFEVELETVEPEPAVASRNDARRAAQQTPSILLVEDHLDTAEVLAHLLSAKGCRVRVVHTVADALRVPDDDFDIVLSDVQLPDATGLELMERLRMRRPVRGIAMSGYGFERDVRRSLEAGFSRHLIKPVKVEDVLDAIDEVAGD